MVDRAQRIERFLAAHGWRAAESRPFAGDASFRHYRRLVDRGRRAVLMDAPPAHEDVCPFVRVARHLRAVGLSAPEILAADVEAGLLLLEDFGDDTFTRLLDRGVDAGALYALAVDVLIYLHRLPPPRAALPDLPSYDCSRLLDEALLLTDWYMPALFERPTPVPVRNAYIAAWREAFHTLRDQPTALVLRDYHVDNLMWLADRDGVAACGLLDFQDAVAGPAAYDVMSLLEDARRDVPEALKTEMLARYVQAFPDLDRATFTTAFATLAAQRHTKVIGIFTRLCRRDGKPAYLVHVPRVWRLLERALSHPALAGVAPWFDCHLPRATRGIPRCRAMAE